MDEQKNTPSIRPKKKKGLFVALFIALLLAVVGLVLVLAFMSNDNIKDESKTSSSTETQSDTDSSDATSASSNSTDYDGKRIAITSTDGKIDGIADITYEEGNTAEDFQVSSAMLIRDALPENPTPAPGGMPIYGSHYYYAQEMVLPEGKGDVPFQGGMVGSVYCNEDVFPDDPSLGTLDLYGWSACDVDGSPPTSIFSIGFTAFYDTYEDVMAGATVRLYDASDYWIEQEDGGKISDSDSAIKSGEMVREYTLIYSEM